MPASGKLRSSVPSLFFAAFALSGALACGSSPTHSGTPDATAGSGPKPHVDVPVDPGKPIPAALPEEQAVEAARLQQEVNALRGLSAAGFAERHPVSFQAPPSYDLASIAGLDLIQKSSLKLGQEELAQLQSSGFTITDRRGFPGFAYGYATIYLEDLPVYVSADSILDAIHQSYEAVLQLLEQEVLSAELSQMLAGMHTKLAAGAGQEVDAQAAADADLFVAVARSLLAGSLVGPAAGGNAQEVRELFELAQKAQGTRTLSLFGVTRRDEDFSQFEPRGHYTNSPALSRYFRAMMWLGRVDLRLLETQPNGEQLFRRRQLQIMVLLRDLIGRDLRPSFDRLDRTIGAFVGEPDYMTLPQVDLLLEALGVSNASALSSLSDETIVQAIMDGGFGAQRISSHIMVAPPHAGALPLSRSFALLGQRYVLDSHVFSNVVYDRVNGPGPKRMMPNPLDAAFAALANDQAGQLLSKELIEYEGIDYPGALARMRLLSDEHPADYWSKSLYTSWLGALRELSPASTSAAADAASLFPVARSEAWGRRLINTQLASWANLRHDTILYAKQSYTGGAACAFPDAYVDPYPRFFAALSAYATRGAELVDSLGIKGELTARVRDYFLQSAQVTAQLQAIAEHQRSGTELTPAMLAFINEAVVVQAGCGSPGSIQEGWYKRLFFDPLDAATSAPQVADVHTQPTDEGGAPVGHVLHVGTGAPRLMVVVAEGCSGPRAYAGLASSYRELVTNDFERLNDEAWKGVWSKQPEPPWMRDLVRGSAVSVMNE